MAVVFQCSSCARFEPLLSARQCLTLPFQRKPLFCSIPLSSRARNLCSSIVAASSKNKNKKKLSRDFVTEDDGEDEDAFELLFKQLEEDLKRGDLSDGDVEDEITEEDMAAFERELEDALEDFDAELLNSDFKDSGTGSDTENDDDDDDGVDGDKRSPELKDWRLKKLARALRQDMEVLEKALSGFDDDVSNSDVIDVENSTDSENDGDGGDVVVAVGDGDEKSLKLRNWQMKKLARALKAGRRKTSIKNLAADLCLDRALVLQLLRFPPPDLLMMSLSIPDEPTTTVVAAETMPSEIVLKEASIEHADPGPKAKVPVHTLQRNWYAQKRLKKAHVDTLERVYRRSKRPTNAMISSIVHVTNIPRKRVVKWFEDKRTEEGVPDRRLPYQRSDPDTA